ncbi:MAG: hypothetical protein JWQ35_616 [Bacteriovoracaceae bacterium]|nr:hypothetical protein [Bacteriovoracaceae bacterium]
MTEWAGMVFVFCLISIAIILMFLSVHALGDPTHFIKWFSPVHWMTREIFGSKAAKFDGIISHGIGLVTLCALIFVSFFMGGWFVTAFFTLWNSPFARIVFP